MYDLLLMRLQQTSYTPTQVGNYHHGISCNTSAAVNVFSIGKQYLTSNKAKAAVT